MSTTKRHAAWMTVESDDKMYLYASDIQARKRLDEQRLYYAPKELAKPLTKREALRLASALLRWAVQ